MHSKSALANFTDDGTDGAIVEYYPDVRTNRIKVIYALRTQQVVEEVTVPVGSTAAEVIKASSLLRRFPEIDLSRNSIGVYSRLIGPDSVVEDGDRIEIYRPLVADPKAIRRQLAKEGKTMGRGGKK